MSKRAKVTRLVLTETALVSAVRKTRRNEVKPVEATIEVWANGKKFWIVVPVELANQIDARMDDTCAGRLVLEFDE